MKYYVYYYYSTYDTLTNINNLVFFTKCDLRLFKLHIKSPCLTTNLCIIIVPNKYNNMNIIYTDKTIDIICLATTIYYL